MTYNRLHHGPIRRRMRIAAALGAIATGAALCTPAKALDVLYNFEGDTGTTVLDKLTLDGSTDATLRGNVVFESTPGLAPFGTQAANLKFTDPIVLDTLNQYTSLEIPDSAFLGSQFTLSGFIDFQATLTPTSRARLFSTYAGTGAVAADRILVDFTADPASTLPIRFLAEGTSTGPVTRPAAMDVPGYHHFAVTYNDGIPKMYIDGQDVPLTFEFQGGVQINMPLNLRFGEDPHDAPNGLANEQYKGNVDDLLVVNRELSAGEIAAIAAGGVAGNFTPAGESLVAWYDFEGDSGTSITDKFVTDGAQHAIVHQTASVDVTADNAAFGTQSGSLVPVPTAVLPSRFSLIDLGDVGSLGDSFTMSAVVNMTELAATGGKLARLFSNFSGSGSAAGRFIFDIDPNALNPGIGLRVILPDSTNLSIDQLFTTNENHLFSMTYDAGELKVYLDGVEIGSKAATTTGAVDLSGFALRVGEDLAGAYNEQLVGIVDDVMILSRALSASEMAQLAAVGADAFLSATPTPMPDLNMDGKVDIFDVAIVSNNWANSGAPGTVTGDANKDGVVDIFDVALISNNWNPGGGASAVPEPTTWALCMLAVAGMFALGRRIRR